MTHHIDIGHITHPINIYRHFLEKEIAKTMMKPGKETSTIGFTVSNTKGQNLMPEVVK